MEQVHAADLLQAAYLLLEVRDAVEVAADEADLTDAVLIRQRRADSPSGDPALTTAGRRDLHKQGGIPVCFQQVKRTFSTKGYPI